MLVLIGALVVTGFRRLLAEEQRLLVQKYVALLRLQAKSEILLAVRPHLERILQQQLALLR